MRVIYPIIALLLLSCGGEIDRTVLIPDANGKPGNIQVLMETSLWDGPVGNEIRANFDQYAVGVYLRPEPSFEYYQIEPKKFNGTLRYSRNILQIKLRKDTTYEKTTVTEYYDRYARGQLFIQIADSDPTRLLKFMKRDFPMVSETFNAYETERLVKNYTKEHHKAIDEAARKNMGVSVFLPKGTELKVEEKNFIWGKHDRSKNQIAGKDNRFEAGTYWIQQGFLIWEVPYKDTAQLSPRGVLSERDTILKYHVPGKTEGSYMSTEYDPFYAPEVKVLEYKGAYAVKVWGLWKHAGNETAFGGGPFIQLTVHHEARNSLVTVCGYIYAPKFDKKEYLREIEAVLETITLIEE